MRAFVTGGTGFIGGHVVRQLRERGDEVVALVRSPEKGAALRELGCELVEGDLSAAAAIRAGIEGCDGAFHIGAVYEVGITKGERPAMYDANVGGTATVLDAAIDAGVPRILYVSTVGVFGNTRGEMVHEGWRRPDRRFTSYYEETKVLAHDVADDRIAKGAPIVIVQPGGVYGPNDHSELGNLIEQTATGKLPAKVFPDAGIMMCHVEDIAAGIVLAFDKGEIGEAYILADHKATFGELIDRVAAIAERKPPRFTMPTALLKASAPLGPVIGPVLGFPKNLRELITTSDGVTFYASDEKARRDLGFSPRGIDAGLRETVEAAIS
jgi:nucleoside-diphosphate-sugar epimerase